jgi:annexin A7/11
VTPREEYFAEQIHKAISGAGTDDDKLVRVIAYLSKANELMKAVNSYYTHLHKHTLVNVIGGDTSGWYKKTMQALVQNRVAL